MVVLICQVVNVKIYIEVGFEFYVKRRVFVDNVFKVISARFLYSKQSKTVFEPDSSLNKFELKRNANMNFAVAKISVDCFH